MYDRISPAYFSSTKSLSILKKPGDFADLELVEREVLSDFMSALHRSPHEL